MLGLVARGPNSPRGTSEGGFSKAGIVDLYFGRSGCHLFAETRAVEMLVQHLHKLVRATCAHAGVSSTDAAH